MSSATTSTTATSNTQNLANVLGRVGDITLSNVLNGTGQSADVGLLVKSMASAILGIAESNVTGSGTPATDAQNISTFLSNVAAAVAAFCAFLDYDDNGVVQLVTKDANGNVVIGNDILAMEKDFNGVTSAFKNQGNIGTTVLAVLSSITMYLTSPHITTEEANFAAFKTACGNVYTSYAPIKSIDHTQYFQENAADIMSFIITLCVIAIPTIELANQKIAAINAAKANNQVIDPASLTITNAVISQAVTATYGVNLGFILSTITDVVTVFVKLFNASGAGTKIANFFKTKLCCCCVKSS